MPDADAVAIKEYITGLSPPLMHLSVSDHDFESPQGVTTLAAGLTSATALTSLELWGIQLHAFGARQLAPAFECLRCLQLLTLANNELCNQAITLLAPAFG